MNLAATLASLPQPIKEQLAKQAERDIKAVVDAMAGASDLRIIGTLQGRYATLNEIYQRLTA